MDTKWKNINSNKYYKIFLIMLFLVTVFVGSYLVGDLLVKADQGKVNMESIFYKNVAQDSETEYLFYEASFELLKAISNGNVNKAKFKYLDKFNYYFEDIEGKIYCNMLPNSTNYSPEKYKSMPIYALFKLRYNGYEFLVESYDATDDLNMRGYDWGVAHADIRASMSDKELKDSEKVVAKLYLGLKNESYRELEINFYESRELTLSRIAIGIISILVLLILLVIMWFTAGRKEGEDRIVLRKIDNMYYGILFILLVTLISIFPIFIYEFIRFIDNIYTFDYAVAFTVLMTMPMAALFLVLYYSTARRIRAKVFWKKSLIGTFFRKIKEALVYSKDGVKVILGKGEADKSNASRILKLDLMYVGISALIVFLVILFINSSHGIIISFFILLELFITYLFITYSLDITRDLDDTIDERLQDMIKSERTKTELITGVSHDLKTPITSIVAYIDLLKKEKDDLSEKANEYVEVLSIKADKLSEMVKDLFDIAKTASGDVVIDNEVIDVNKLIRQTLADMHDVIEQSGFVIKEKYETESLTIDSDGKKLYRVIQNLLDNAVKYSLEGTRIYIETKRVEDRAVISIKNTASYDMNFDSEEIVKKFVRADESRSSDGSGLGLAISSTFVSALGGSFDIVVDGDQFKAIVSL